MSKKSELRRSTNVRLFVLLGLLVILAICYFVFEKFRLWILGLIAVVLVAFGLELSGTDMDLGKLIETGSVKESMITKTESGMWLINECEKKENFNCDNFAYQEEAQTLFEECGGIENDVHGLDRDKDGIVCEANKKRPLDAGSKSVWEILGYEGEVEADTSAEETTNE
ncbi:hypothetical protein GW756_04325 [bacterium]|nr:hypothetical protein [bacterium]NCQ55174.1 hypothetical protein [Candidatus Parcubacteria bacterium]NCS67313.1 hypothetical protein [Candidatus Peregrinibacteria bacterium]NCS96568.1 hypothetical protein [bacterium]